MNVSQPQFFAVPMTSLRVEKMIGLLGLFHRVLNLVTLLKSGKYVRICEAVQCSGENRKVQSGDLDFIPAFWQAGFVIFAQSLTLSLFLSR